MKFREIHKDKEKKCGISAPPLLRVSFLPYNLLKSEQSSPENITTLSLVLFPVAFFQFPLFSTILFCISINSRSELTLIIQPVINYEF